MANCGSGGGRIGGGSSPPRPPVFRSEAEWKKWVASEGARKRATRRWTNWWLTPPGKLARYANNSEGSSSRGSCRPPSPPVVEDSSVDEEDVEAMRLDAGDYVHNDDEEEAAIQQASVISVTEVRARFRREEADTVRQVREYEAAQKEARVRRVKLEVIALDDE